MSNLSTNTCLLCDLPWKNNRVCYDGKMRLPPYCGMVSFDASTKHLYLVCHKWLLVVNLNTGETLYALPAEGDLCCPMLYELVQTERDPVPVVCAGDDAGTLYTWNRATGDLLWKAPLTGAIAGPPAYQDGLLYAATKDGKVHRINAADGSQQGVMAAGQVVEGVLHDGEYYLLYKAE